MSHCHLLPPFPSDQSLVSPSTITHPAAVRTASATLVLPSQNLKTYISQELSTTRLSRLHKYLWLAGLPVPARPLHRQQLMNRTIIVTERADEHLVWHQHRIFVKPLPAFLLCHAFWEAHLCADPGLHASACGMLLSYTWLVAHRSDFAIATLSHLLPPGLTFESWTSFSRSVLSSLDLATLDAVDARYQYGELRLSRLDLVTRWQPLLGRGSSSSSSPSSSSCSSSSSSSSTWSPRSLVDGYMHSSTWRTAFFSRHFGWVVASFIYISVVLSALQVGLATDVLQASNRFQSLGLVVTLVGLVVLFLALGSMVAVWAGLFCYHLLGTIAFDRRVRFDRSRRLMEKRTLSL